MLSTIFDKLKENNYADLKGAFSCKIPFSIEVVNALLSKADDKSEVIKKLEVISINGDEINFNMTLGGVKFAKKLDIVDRDLILKIHPVLTPPKWSLKIEILDGIRRLENELIELLFNTWFKNSIVDFENRMMIINHSELFENKTYRFLLQNLDSAKLETQPDKIFYDLHFNFN